MSGSPTAVASGGEFRRVLHTAGGTETGPVGSLPWVKGDLSGLPGEERSRTSAKQGMAMPLIELRLIGDDGTEQPLDGKSMGEVEIRGPWVASTYYNDERHRAVGTRGGCGPTTWA